MPLPVRISYNQSGFIVFDCLNGNVGTCVDELIDTDVDLMVAAVIQT